MTKLRAPLTVQQALCRIAGVLGWDRMAQIADREERTVRDWSDPDTPSSPPIDCAIPLDIAHAAEGGDGFPMFEAYSHQLDIARRREFACQVELARRTAVSVRESGEAHAALVRVTLPGADEAARVTAIRELEESIAASKSALMVLTQGFSPTGTSQ